MNNSLSGVVRAYPQHNDRFRLTKSWAVLWVALFLALSGNLAFFQKVLALYSWGQNTGFIVALFLLIVAVFVLFFSVLTLVLPVRLVLAFFLAVTAVTGHFSDEFGTIFDIDMLRSSLETNVAELSDLMSWRLCFRMIFLALIPIVILCTVRYEKKKWHREMLTSIRLGIISLVIGGVCIAVFSSHFSSFFREHKTVRYYVNPIYPFYTIIRYVAMLKQPDKHQGLVMLNAQPIIVESEEQHELVVFVVGETARADHFSLNGYSRETNPLLASEKNLIFYSDIHSCGTSTAVSVPCLFSYHARDGFDVDIGRRTQNILDVLKESGVSVLWRDNNSDSKGMADRVEYQNFRDPTVNPVCDVECRDVGMLSGLQDYVDAQSADVLIVLHQMGSHGPAYYKRYPEAFERFTPVCQTGELAECRQDEIVNAYDNTILYTDYFLSQVIAFLKSNTPRFETTLFYVSDHGESLGEKGLYLHGMPYFFAPESQTKVPLILWVGESSDIAYQKTLSLKDLPNSHDAVFKTLLSLFEVNTRLTFESYAPLVYLKDGN